MDTVSILKRVDFFQVLHESHLERIAKLFSEESHPKGTVIFKENDAGEKFYILKKGEIEISKRISEEIDEQAELMVFKPYNYFGEMSLIDESPRSATVIAATDVTLLTMSKHNFLQVCLEFPKIIFYLIRTMSQRLRHMNDQFVEVIDDLIKKNKMAAIGSAASKIVHDIKTPITVIVLTAQLLENIFPDTGKYVKKMVRQTQVLNDMILEILDYAKGEKISLNIGHYDFTDVFAEIVESVGPLADDRNIKLTCNNQVKTHVPFDYRRITRTIINIVKNAIEAMTKPGSITIDCSPVGQKIYLSISDTGPGIPDSIINSIFEPFVTQGKASGTGLGLAICQKVVTDHGGTISCSNHPDGAKFDIILPAVRD